MSSFLSVTGVVLVLIGIILLFSNGWIAFCFIMLGCGFIQMYGNTPEGKAAIAKTKAKAAEVEANKKATEKANKLAEIKLKESLESRFQQLSMNPSDIASLQYLLKNLEPLNKNFLRTLMHPIVIPLFGLKPLDQSVREVVFNCTKKMVASSFTPRDAALSQDLYDAALEALSRHPDQLVLRQYVLEVGRWHSTTQRSDGKVTIYDEQSIQNDIAVRSK